jgi:FeS assembly SUF system protein
MEGSETQPTELRERIVEVLHTVYDPEIPVDIYELGLVYGIEIDESSRVKLRMTLTAPGCPVAGSMPEEIRQKLLSIPGVTDAEIELVWDPPWNPGMMSEAARLTLGF